MKIALLLLLIGGCSIFGGRRSIVDGTPFPSPIDTPAVSDSTDVQALLALVAQLEAEISALKQQSGRDSFAGLTIQNAMSLTLGVLLAVLILSEAFKSSVDRFCEYREEMARIARGKCPA